MTQIVKAGQSLVRLLVTRTFVALIVASISSAHYAVAQTDTKRKPNTSTQTALYSDPFAYCKATINVDCSLEGGKCDKRYSGPTPPPVVAKSLGKKLNEVAWRCMNEKVMGCYLGASGSACQKREAGTLPRGIKEFCSQNPNEEMLSRAQFGPDAPEKWKCANGLPVAKGGQAGVRLDSRGYLRDSWKVISE